MTLGDDIRKIQEVNKQQRAEHSKQVARVVAAMLSETGEQLDEFQRNLAEEFGNQFETQAQAEESSSIDGSEERPKVQPGTT